MQAFTQVTGAAAHLPLDNVDTDIIIRIEHITSTPRAQLGHYAFQALRLLDGGSENPACVFNQPPFRDAPILLAGRNFGCGSSRETAVTAMFQRGIRCVIAPSFGDIFFNNCFQNGLLPVVMAPEVIAVIAARSAAGAAVTVDLEAREVRTADAAVFPFEIEAMRRESMLSGLDEIGLTLRDDDTTRAWQARDRQARPWVWLGPRPEAGTTDIPSP